MKPVEEEGVGTEVDHAAFRERPAGPMRCVLVVIDGADSGRAASLGNEPVTIGSEAGCSLRLEDPTVSRTHATVQAAPGGFLVTDHGSTNGTLYEGCRVAQAVVGPGSVLRVGRTSLLVRPEGSAEAIAPSPRKAFGQLVSESVAMRRLFAVLEQVAGTESTVLLEGETGTGKELAAFAVHETSPRRAGPFVVFDCAAVPRDLIESELFGHLRGSFTGAAHDRPGAFVRAAGGTIFLDELSALPLDLQPKLLRVLEARSVKPVGGDEPQAVDVRVIAAANTDIEAEVRAGRVRADLFYRLSVVHVRIPPLRRRPEDIAPIVRRLLARLGCPDPGEISGPGLDRLVAHSWPGNVRELRNVIERAVALAGGTPPPFLQMRIDLGAGWETDELRVHIEKPYVEAKERLLEEFERRYLGELMRRCEDNISLASRVSALDRKHLRRLLRRHGFVAGPMEDDE
ncbi:MAG: sigma 54-dependent Fis family transcriptional regulator [Deltaproteobacteria bacterium]|nr:sigma 54-dependent Fis family transcriptional regulator [Deltaproteobacteria bacterium]